MRSRPLAVPVVGTYLVSAAVLSGYLLYTSAVDTVVCLQGNRGNQQYVVPDGAAAGAVVIWCRAFTVAFGTASLR